MLTAVIFKIWWAPELPGCLFKKNANACDPPKTYGIRRSRGRTQKCVLNSQVTLVHIGAHCNWSTRLLPGTRWHLDRYRAWTLSRKIRMLHWAAGQCRVLQRAWGKAGLEGKYSPAVTEPLTFHICHSFGINSVISLNTRHNLQPWLLILSLKASAV